MRNSDPLWKKILIILLISPVALAIGLVVYAFFHSLFVLPYLPPYFQK